MSCSTMKDVSGEADMMQGSLTQFAADRFGNPNASLDLNEGWTQLPTGIYFDTPEFSVSLWVFPKTAGINSRLFDCGNGQASDNVLLTILKPFFCVYSGKTPNYLGTSSKNLTFNQWQFFTLTFNGTQTNMYINSDLVINKTVDRLTMATVTRNSCYIGKSHWPSNGNTGAYLDDLRFYNVSLTQTEVIELMNQNETGLNIAFLL